MNWNLVADVKPELVKEWVNPKHGTRSEDILIKYHNGSEIVTTVGFMAYSKIRDRIYWFVAEFDTELSDNVEVYEPLSWTNIPTDGNVYE